jgi:hypothetical protein
MYTYTHRVELILVVSMTLWIVISFITLLAFPTSLSNEGLIIIGSFADTSSFIYYCAPLSFAVEVIMTKNSKRFYIPTILLNLLTTILWFLYGLVGVNEITVWLPNIIGNICFLYLCHIYMYIHVYQPLSCGFCMDWLGYIYIYMDWWGSIKSLSGCRISSVTYIYIYKYIYIIYICILLWFLYGLVR